MKIIDILFLVGYQTTLCPNILVSLVSLKRPNSKTPYEKHSWKKYRLTA